MVKFGEKRHQGRLDDLPGATDDWSAGPRRRRREQDQNMPASRTAPTFRARCRGEIMQARVKAGWITEADLAKQTRRRTPRRKREAQPA